MNEETDPQRRTRPSYGLPGPQGTPVEGGERSAYHGPRYGESSTAEDARTDGWQTGTGAPTGSGYSPLAATGPGTGPGLGAAPAKRRGLLPLLLGIGLLVLAVVSLLVGIVMAVVGTIEPVQKGATPFGGPSTQLEIEPGQMYYVYVPAADAEATTCTAEATTGAMQVVSLSGRIDLGDGQPYEQKIAVASEDGASVTVTCEGTDGAAHLGPIGLWSTLRPILIGGGLGLLLGAIGLVLLVLGIVRLVRSRRRA